MSAQNFRQLAKAPATVSDSLSGGSIDYTTVTSAVFRYKKPDGTTGSWTGTLSSQSSSGVTVSFTFGGTELDQTGIWHVWVECATATSAAPAGQTFQLVVQDNYTDTA